MHGHDHAFFKAQGFLDQEVGFHFRAEGDVTEKRAAGFPFGVLENTLADERARPRPVGGPKRIALFQEFFPEVGFGGFG
jgi:hypothetical protein